ncbi:MAG: hypothetical protein RLZZ535_3431, partial [Cyanobacteriota bacterium]
NLNLNFLFGAALVFGITVVMMGWRSGLIVGTALPLSVLMVLGWMNWFNKKLEPPTSKITTWFPSSPK